MANRVRILALTGANREELERLQRSPSTTAGLSRRARAVLLMADSVPGTEVARLTGYTPVQVSRIRRRFAEEGMAGLLDKPRSGRPPEMTDAKPMTIDATGSPVFMPHWRSLRERSWGNAPRRTMALTSCAS